MNKLFILFTVAILSTLLFVSTAISQRVNPIKGPGGCQRNLEMCTNVLSTCDSDLVTCAAEVGTLETELMTCDDDLMLCETATCGNNIAEFGEDCDGNNLQGATCESEGFLYGNLSCDSSCMYDTSGCTDDRYIDHGDGTVTDNATCLQWEKKTDDGTIHDTDNTYTWGFNVPEQANGTVFTDFLNKLNNTCDGAGTLFCAIGLGCTSGVCGFAGYRDWRLPSVNRDGGSTEFETLIDNSVEGCGSGSSCIDENVFGPTQGANFFYWTSISTSFSPFSSYVVSFGNLFPNQGNVFNRVHDNAIYVRAVRNCSD